MAIHPIDLQTLFTQMDKVAKTQVQEKAALLVQKEQQALDQQKVADMQSRAVTKTPEQEEGTEKIKERRRGRDGGDSSGRHERDENDRPEESSSAEIHDPNLGQHIDLSG